MILLDDNLGFYEGYDGKKKKVYNLLLYVLSLLLCVVGCTMLLFLSLNLF